MSQQSQKVVFCFWR